MSSLSEQKRPIQERIRQIGICESVRESYPSAYEFFEELLQRHPEKERKRVADMIDLQIEKHPKNDYVLRMLFHDGTSDTISWNKCLRGRVVSPDLMLSRAMREAIDSQILEFRQRHWNAPCAFCGSTRKLTVDHCTPFIELKRRFLEERTDAPTEFGKNSFQQDCFTAADAGFQRAWENFHRNSATLQILCMPCNWKKGRT